MNTLGDFKGTMNALAVLPSFPANFPFAEIVGDLIAYLSPQQKNALGQPITAIIPNSRGAGGVM